MRYDNLLTALLCIVVGLYMLNIATQYLPFMMKFRYALNILKSRDKSDIYLSTFHHPLIGFHYVSVQTPKQPFE